MDDITELYERAALILSLAVKRIIEAEGEGKENTSDIRTGQDQ